MKTNNEIDMGQGHTGSQSEACYKGMAVAMCGMAIIMIVLIVLQALK